MSHGVYTGTMYENLAPASRRGQKAHGVPYVTKANLPTSPTRAS